MTVDEICEQYPDDWLLIKFIEPQKPEWEGEGELMARGASSGQMWKAIGKVRKKEPTACLGVLHGGKPVRDGATFWEQLKQVTGDDRDWSVNKWGPLMSAEEIARLFAANNVALPGKR